MTDFSKYIEKGLALIYEIGAKHKVLPRWSWKIGVGWIDRGYTEEYTAAFVHDFIVQTGAGNAAVIQLKDPTLMWHMPMPGHVLYTPKQWDFPGFFAPPGGWGHYLKEVKKIVECSCGAEAYARLTRGPVTGHSPYCQINNV